MMDAATGSVLPTSDRERIGLLDAFRGLAVMGIAAANVMFFTYPLAELTHSDWSRRSPAQHVAFAVVSFIAEHQFFPIFAMLFGMGFALQSSRFTQPRGFRRLHLRRMAVLLGFGVAHGVLLWYGDILAMYAVVGLLLLVFRNRSPRTLLISGLVVFMVPVAMQVVTMASSPHARRQSLYDFRNAVADQIRRAPDEAVASMSRDAGSATRPTATASSPATGPAGLDREYLAQRAEVLVAWLDFFFDDQRVYTCGTWNQMILHRGVIFLLFTPVVALTHMGWRALGLMLVGMYMCRRGFFCVSNGHDRAYRRLLIVSLVCGVLVQAVGLIARYQGGAAVWSSGLNSVCIYIGSIGISLAYMSALYLLFRQPAWRRRLHFLVCAGQMSLTVYIGSSFLFGLVFYGYGLSQFGMVGPALTQFIALIVVALLALFSVAWLNWFQHGPLEWVWRVLAYARMVPLLRRASKDELPAAVREEPASVDR